MSGYQRPDCERIARAIYDQDAEVCPRCGKGYLLPGTAAAAKGLCPACNWRILAEAQEQEIEEMKAFKAYQNARKTKSRARKGSNK